MRRRRPSVRLRPGTAGSGGRCCWQAVSVGMCAGDGEPGVSEARQDHVPIPDGLKADQVVRQSDLVFVCRQRARMTAFRDSLSYLRLRQLPYGCNRSQISASGMRRVHRAMAWSTRSVGAGSSITLRRLISLNFASGCITKRHWGQKARVRRRTEWAGFHQVTQRACGAGAGRCAPCAVEKIR